MVVEKAARLVHARLPRSGGCDTGTQIMKFIKSNFLSVQNLIY